MQRAGAQRFEFAQAPRLHHPQLPVHAEPLQLAMRTETHATASLHHLVELFGQSLEDVLIVAIVRQRLPRIEFVVWREATQLRVIIHVVVRHPVIQTNRATVAHHQRWCVGNAALRLQLHDVLEQREDRHGVLEAGIPVLHEREVHREVGATLGRGGKPQLLRGHDHPLAHFAVAGEILLDRLRVVVIGVPAQHITRLVQALDVVGGEDAGARGIQTRSDQRARFHEIGVGENVGGRRLRIALRGDAVGEVGEQLRHLIAMHAPAEPVVRVNIHVAGENRLPVHIDLACTAGNGHRATRPDRCDAIVGDDDITALDHVAALHGDQSRVPQHHRATRLVLRGRDRHVEPSRFVRTNRCARGIAWRASRRRCGARDGIRARHGVTNRPFSRAYVVLEPAAANGIER